MFLKWIIPALKQYAVPENIDSQPMEGQWKFQGGGCFKWQKLISKGKYEVNLRFQQGLYMSVTNTKAYATLVTEHILFWLCIVTIFSLLSDIISVILLMP